MSKFNPTKLSLCTVAEVAAIQITDNSVSARYRGAPILKTYAPPTFLGMLIKDVTSAHFQTVLNQYLAGRPPTETGYRLVSDFNTFMKWAIENDFRPQPYVRFMPPKAIPRATTQLSMDTIRAILAAADDLYSRDVTVAIFIRALALLGLGVNDTANFSLDRVDFAHWEYIQDDARGRLRLIPIPLSMRNLVSKARQLQPDESVHKRDTYAWISPLVIREIVHRLGLACGIPNLTPIQITHTCLFG